MRHADFETSPPPEKGKAPALNHGGDTGSMPCESEQLELALRENYGLPKASNSQGT